MASSELPEGVFGSGQCGTLFVGLGLFFRVWLGGIIMGRFAFVLAAAAFVSGAWAVTPDGGGVVYLDDAALAALRTANPGHYARAQKILSAANQLCRPTAGEVEYAKFDAKNIACIRSLIKTSNPPKRQISFRLDNTEYIALVTLTDDPPRLVTAGPQR